MDTVKNTDPSEAQRARANRLREEDAAATSPSSASSSTWPEHISPIDASPVKQRRQQQHLGAAATVASQVSGRAETDDGEWVVVGRKKKNISPACEEQKKPGGCAAKRCACEDGCKYLFNASAPKVMMLSGVAFMAVAFATSLLTGAAAPAGPASSADDVSVEEAINNAIKNVGNRGAGDRASFTPDADNRFGKWRQMLSAGDESVTMEFEKVVPMALAMARHYSQEPGGTVRLDVEGEDAEPDEVDVVTAYARYFTLASDLDGALSEDASLTKMRASPKYTPTEMVRQLWSAPVLQHYLNFSRLRKADSEDLERVRYMHVAEAAAQFLVQRVRSIDCVDTLDKALEFVRVEEPVETESGAEFGLFHRTRMVPSWCPLEAAYTAGQILRAAGVESRTDRDFSSILSSLMLEVLESGNHQNTAAGHAAVMFGHNETWDLATRAPGVTTRRLFPLNRKFNETGIDPELSQHNDFLDAVKATAKAGRAELEGLAAVAKKNREQMDSRSELLGQGATEPVPLEVVLYGPSEAQCADHKASDNKHYRKICAAVASLLRKHRDLFGPDLVAARDRSLVLEVYRTDSNLHSPSNAETNFVESRIGVVRAPPKSKTLMLWRAMRRDESRPGRFMPGAVGEGYYMNDAMPFSMFNKMPTDSGLMDDWSEAEKADDIVIMLRWRQPAAFALERPELFPKLIV